MSGRRSVVAAGYMPLDAITSHESVTHQAGGTAGNVAAILAYLGWKSVLAGQIGNDPAGARLLRDLRNAGVETSQIHAQDGMATPRVIHRVRPDGHAFLYRCPECERGLPRSRPLTLDQAGECVKLHPRADVFFFDRANAATLGLAEHYAEAGAVIVFEPSVPANADSLRRAASVAHLIKHSDDRSVGGLEDIGVRRRHGQWRVTTHGAEGLELRTGSGRSRRHAAFATVAVDAGGAGDWTTAGLIARAVGTGGLSEVAIDDAVRFGQALAALNCTAVGARGLMRLTRRTVLKHARTVLADGGVTNPPRFGEPPASVTGSACAICLQPHVGVQLRIAAAG